MKQEGKKKLSYFIIGMFICMAFAIVLPQVSASITSNEGAGWADIDMQWFAKTRHGGAGGFRASVGIDPASSSGQDGYFTGGWTWTSGTSYDFELVYTALTGYAELYVTGQNGGLPICEYAVGPSNGKIGINARSAPETGMSTIIENIKFNGVSVTPDDSVTATSAAGECAVRHLLLEGADLSNDFTIEGEYTFYYGSSTYDECPSMVIDVEDACVPDIPVNSGYDPEATCSNGARWRNFRLDGNGWELAVGEDIGSYNPGWSNVDFVYSGDYYFTPDGPNTFTYIYNAVTGDQTIEAIVDGGTFSTVQNNGNLGYLNYLQFDVVGRNGQTVEFNNVILTVDGTPYNLCNYEAGGWTSYYIDTLDLSNGFSMTGEVYLTGQATSQEGSKINICVGSSSCTPICRNVEDNIEYCTIQEAIDATTTSDGETIEIYSGTHVEQVNIYKELTLYGQGQGVTTIQSPDTLTDYFTTSNNNYPVMYVNNVDNVVIEDLTVDGAGKGNANYRFVGIGIFEAGATISNVEVIGVRDTPFSGAQHGVAIYGWADTGAHDVVIEDCFVYDYQKTGIALGGSGLDVLVSGCDVTGVGPTTVTAQNGIQVSHGSTGSITGNTVSGCSYTGPSWAASGILPYLSGGTLDISNNILSENQANIYLCACSADITGNTITASAAGTGQTYFYGIIGDPGDPPIIPDADPVDDGTPPLNRVTYVITCEDNVVTGDGSSGGVGIGVYAGMYGSYDIDFTAMYNDVYDWGVGFELYEYAPNELITADIHYNNIVGNDYGIYNWLTTVFDVSCNWYGDSSGPTHTSNPSGTGDMITDNLYYCPWLDDAYPYGDCIGGAICRNVDTNEYFCCIQCAVDDMDTLDGHTIEIFAGTHVEQVNIYKELTLYGQGTGVTTIQSPDTLTDYFTTSNNNYPVMFVNNVDNVVIEDLTVDGAGKGNANYRFVGIGIYEAGATISNVEVINVRDTPFSGAQHGVAIYAWADTGAHDVIVEDCFVYDYQKTGIALGGSGLDVLVSGCEVTGVGPTTVTAQNGIQVSHGAIGSITGNTVSGCSYTGSGWAASGILPYLSGGTLIISDNEIFENQANIYLAACSADITGNNIYATAAGTGQTYFYGIIGDPGDPPVIPDADPVDDGTPPLERTTYVFTCEDNVVTGDGTSGGVGIGVYAGMYGTYDIDFTAMYNNVLDWGVGFELYEYAPNELISANINYNNIVGNDYGIYNWLTTTYDCTCNWYGYVQGPIHPSNPAGVGDPVTDYVDFLPWLNLPFEDPESMCQVGLCQDPVYVDNDYNYATPGYYIDHFTTIQDGVDHVCPGGTVYVENGQYFENVEVNTEDITIIGVNPPPLGLTGQTAAIVTGNMEIYVDGITVENLVFEASEEGAVHVMTGVDGSSINVNHNKFLLECNDDAIGVVNDGTGLVNAQFNYWGGYDGPSGMLADPITGRIANGYALLVDTNVIFDAWAGVDAMCDASATSVETNDPISFSSDESFAYHLDGTENSYMIRWDFDDGTYSYDATATHLFSTPGTYQVSMRIQAFDSQLVSGFMFDWDYVTITVTSPGAPLSANADGQGLGGYETVVDESVQLFGSASGGTAPYTFSWDLGTGETVSEQNPIVTFDTPGTYEVTLTVTDDEGGQDSDTSEIVVYDVDELVASITAPSNGIANNAVMFRSSVNGGVSPYTYLWDFGDGSTSTEMHPNHVYSSPGEYTITLRVTDDDGTVDEDSAVISIEKEEEPAEIVEISGGLFLKARIAAGDAPVEWSIQIDGNVMVGGSASGQIAMQTEETVKLPFTFGFGKVDITVMANTQEETLSAFLFGPLFLNLN